MAASIIEGIDNEVLFVLAVFVAFVAIFLVHFLYNSNRISGPSFNLNAGQNVPDTASGSVHSSPSEENSEGGSSNGPDANPTGSEPLQTDTEATSEQVNNTSIPQMDSTTDGVRWRGDESMPDSHSPNTSSTPGESISIRVKFMENERTLSVNRTIKVGDLKRLCFRNELNSGQRVRLIYSGRLLQDDTAPISFYGIENYSVLHAQISDVRRTDENEQSTTYHQEADLDLSKLFLPILAIILTLCWYGFFYYRHLFSAASVIILVFMTFAFGVLAHVITS